MSWLPVTQDLSELKSMGSVDLRAFAKGPLHVMVGREPRSGGLKWHMSISHPNRFPTWSEIKDARYSMMPTEITVAMILPPPSEYVNVHNNCFHLWEIDDDL